MISCVYRLCDKGERSHKIYLPYRPPWFSKKKCLQSFLNAVEHAGDAIKEVIFIHDGPEGELYDMLPTHHTIKKANKTNNLETALYALDVCKELGTDIYLVEDDYLHKPNSIVAMHSALDKLLFATNYDHPGQYTLHFKETYNFPNKDLEYFDEKTNINWKSADFCCFTFALNKDFFREKSNTFYKNACKSTSLCSDLYMQDVTLWRSDPGLIMQLDEYLKLSTENWEQFNEQIQ
jgi:hypothetical protein